MVGTPISDYGLLSDRHSAALVSTGGSVDWLCFPRFDSPSVFGRLLDEDAGHWSIRPAGEGFSAAREYVDRTLVLRTRFSGDGGELVLTDALVLGPPSDPHQLGVGAPHALARTVTCTRGTVAVAFHLAARPEYGLVSPLLSEVEGGVLVRGGATRLLLSSPIEFEWQGGTASAVFTLHSGQAMSFSLLWALWGTRKESTWSQEEIAERIAQTEAAWLGWSHAHESYTGPWKSEVGLSGRVLHGLGYKPTGAMVAAATTSLPESVGGSRNWDYRYTWVRDASFTMDALWIAACPDEAREFFDFVTVAAATTQQDSGLQIMFGVGGEHDLTERELSHLGGWRGSRPVRVGNGAWRQKQLDVYGELLDTAARFSGRLSADGIDDDPALRDFLRWTADTVLRVWREPDQGIWEMRGEPEHFLHSKLMCWVALDRALMLGFDDRAAEWVRARDEIRAAIEEHGYHDGIGAYTQSFGSEELDSAALMVPIVGFDTGPRAVSTVDVIASRLTDSHGLVYRYSAESNVDGMAQPEGVFLLCTFWLARAYAATGRPAQAREVMERALAWSNDLGLLAEQVDPASGEVLGNFPQAFSHIGLINAAWAIGEAEGTLPA